MSTENQNTTEHEANLEAEKTTLDPVESLQQELVQMKDQWLRAVAETENVRRRSQKEKEDGIKYAATHFARDMLSIADNLRRALESCPDKEGLSDAVKSLIEGIELTESELLRAFERQGIQQIHPIQEKFDPHLHQAMFEVDSPEHAPGTVLNVLQVGYVLHDRLLRPAMVGVAKTLSNSA